MTKPIRVHLKRYNKKNIEPVGISYWNFLTDEEIYGYMIDVKITNFD